MIATDRSESVRALLAGVVDYAGLFPPAALDMEDAVSRYSGYRKHEDAWMLGRFVLPVSRIEEFDSVSAGWLDWGGEPSPWRIAALVGDDISADGETMLKFNCRHWAESALGHAVIDVAELKAATPVAAGAKVTELPKFFSAFVEIPLDTDPIPFVEAIRAAGAGAKARTGGVTSDAFPTAETLARFIGACVSRDTRFKVTAGLHHPLRSEFPLTYAAGSARAMMFGYLNVFLSTALIANGADLETAVRMLEERDAAAIRFTSTGVEWRSATIPSSAVESARRLLQSFGSCSFEEPVNELHTVLA